MKKLTTTLVAALLAGSVGVAFAQSDNSKSMKSGATQSGTMAKTDKNKLTGCNTVAAKEEQGKGGAVANRSSHSATAGTTGTAASGGKPEKGC